MRQNVSVDAAGEKWRGRGTKNKACRRTFSLNRSSSGGMPFFCAATMTRTTIVRCSSLVTDVVLPRLPLVFVLPLVGSQRVVSKTPLMKYLAHAFSSHSQPATGHTSPLRCQGSSLARGEDGVVPSNRKIFQQRPSHSSGKEWACCLRKPWLVNEILQQRDLQENAVPKCRPHKRDAAQPCRDCGQKARRKARAYPMPHSNVPTDVPRRELSQWSDQGRAGRQMPPGAPRVSC
jgi:hypothetical protein